MRFLIGFISIILYFPNLYADHGLHFKSNEVAKEHRTGIDITHKNNIAYSSNFAIHFDISFRESDTHYGDILSLKEISANNSIQINFRDPDLFVIYNKRETKFHCNLEKLKVKNNRWISCELKIDADNSKIHFLLGDTIISAPINFPKNSEFALSFGVVNKYGFIIDEVPSISIKDLSIRVDGAPKHLWPFRKTDSYLLHDVLSSRTARLYNPDWVVNYHNKWTLLDTFSFSTVPSIVFDSKKEIFYFVLVDGKIQSYSPQTKEFKTQPVKSGFPCLEKSQQVIMRDGEICSYSFNKNLVSKYNFENQTWSNNEECSLDDFPKLWHHNKLIHPITKKITTICGYGFYSYFNIIQSFDENNRTWNELKFSGDTISPRYLASFGTSDNNPNIGYLFGGLGNNLGKQILGKEFYYDLFRIDFKNQEIKKLWNYNCQEDLFRYLPVNSMKICENDSCFYTMVFPSLKNSTHLKIVKGYINEPKLVFIGDSIPYEFTDVESFADLYYWESDNQLIATTLHLTPEGTYQVSLNKISYEPGVETEIILKAKNLPLSLNLFYSFLAIILILTVIFIRKRIRSKLKEATVLKDINNLDFDSTPTYNIPQVNSILLLGGFQVFENKGKDITYRFSPTLKELFLLILLYSLDEGKGISSRRIQEFLWPDKSESKAKNNRGVNIKKLRGILEDIPGLEISFDNNYWKIEQNENVFCDLDFIQKQIKLIRKSANSKDIETIIQILKRGTLLRDVNPEWLDAFKDKTTGLIVSVLEDLLINSEVESTLKLAIANAIFEFDHMNETALRIKCFLLSVQGKHSLAVETYDHYRKLYLKLYNEEFKLTFKDIVSENSSI